ncbi:transmembrane protein, putative [Bodo saltans]|uniref:Transmembrane protein, putative n=1 Tax=Bodo saltans TaxID=75058 RepID=A0A0S4JL05_BODSA|nr:transmembrane protein, putative [Bodo saltans]|eukprot:CUG92218.1 transmembrane protein, putative [Bodo saltans]
MSRNLEILRTSVQTRSCRSPRGNTSTQPKAISLTFAAVLVLFCHFSSTNASGEPEHLITSRGGGAASSGGGPSSSSSSPSTMVAGGGGAALLSSSTTMTSAPASFLSDLFSGGGSEVDSIVCTCMCCLQGACVPVANATWAVPSCGACRHEDCLQRASDLDAMWSSETSRRRVSKSPCFVLHTTEQKTCSGMTDRQCHRFTSIKSQCVQRSSMLQTLCCLGWTVIVLILVIHRLWTKYR